MTTLERVEIFAAGGPWNGTTFTTDDLDEMVRGFNEEAQAGKLPVKLGHGAPDTDPARGWLSKVWREGDKLIARIEQVPQDVVDGIKSGAWKFVSVELVSDLKTAAGRTYRWLLDGLALLGSARPAVDTLQPLDKSLNCSAAGVTFRARMAFTVALAPGGRDELAELRAENERLRLAMHRRGLDSQIEADVRARHVQASAREQFRKLFKLTDDDTSYARISVSDWHDFARTQPKPPANTPACFGPTDDAALGAPDTRLVARTHAYIREHEVRFMQLTGRRLTFVEAAPMVVREVAVSDPALVRSYLHQPGEV